MRDIVISFHTFRKPLKSKDFAVKCDASTNIIQLYDFGYDSDTHELKIIKGKKEDRDAFIQSFKDEVGVYNILAKFSLTGDVSLLNQRPAFYGDISDLPVDELNPGAALAAADSSLAKLNALLGTNYSAEELEGLSPEVLQKLINGVVTSKTSSQEEGKKEGE